MEAHWIDEQEGSYTWLVQSSAAEQENVMDWIKSIGVGAAQGAGTGAAAGPWGALIGGLVGGGLGALQQATRPQTPPPAAASPAPVSAVPAPPPSASPRPAPQPPPATPPSARDNAGALQQITQLLPQLVQLIQSIQPAAASAQQGQRRSGESTDLAGDPGSWDGETAADDPWAGEPQADSPHIAGEGGEEIDQPETDELPHTSFPDDPFSAPLERPALLEERPRTQPIPLSVKWSTEEEAIAIVRPQFQWFS